MKLKNLFWTCVALAAVAAIVSGLLLAAPLYAQSNAATLSGTVVDQTGAVIPDVKITVLNPATSGKRQAVTNAEGTFMVPMLQPGKYKVLAERQGFAAVEIPDLVLNTADVKMLQIRLKVSSKGETVTVEAGSITVDTGSAIATVVDRQFVENIPLNGRTFQSLLTLTPGANFVWGIGQISFNGQRTNSNYFTVDGVSANIGTYTDSSTSTREMLTGSNPGFNVIGGTNSLLSVDALEEFKVQSSTYSAEFGRAPGGQVQMTSRSGANKFHGSLFDYFRNDKLDANSYTNNFRKSPKPKLRQNDFGGTLSGPVMPNRTFFFFNYEGMRTLTPSAMYRWNVPSMFLRNDPRINPNLKVLLNAYPLPDPAQPDLVSGGVPTGATAYYYAPSEPKNMDVYSIRMDHRFNDHLQLFGRYNHAPSNSTRPYLNHMISSAINMDTLTLGATMSLTSRMINEVRANYSINEGQSYDDVLDTLGGHSVPKDIYAPYPSQGKGYVYYWTFPGGVYTRSLTWGFQTSAKQRQLNLVDNFTYSRGKHSLKFGVDYRYMFPHITPTQYQMYVTFNSVDSLYRNAADSISISSQDPVTVITTNFSAYAQDSWKLSNRLTLDLGLRWDVNPAPHGTKKGDMLTLLNAEDPANIALAPLGTPMYPTVYTAVAPRLGFAYQVSAVGGWTTVLRGGWGVFLNTRAGGAGAAAYSYPHYRSRSTSYSTANPTATAYPFSAAVLALPDPISVTPPFSSKSFVAFDQKNDVPKSYQWDLSMEQAFGSKSKLTLSYVANAGRNMTRGMTLDIGNQNANFPNSSVLLFRNTGRWGDTSDYQSLQTQFQHKSKSLQILANHTWSHSLDTSSDDTSTGYSYLGDPRKERGESSFDRRHAFNVAVTWDVPSVGVHHGFMGFMNDVFMRDWALNWIFKARTGTPMNVTITRDMRPYLNTNWILRPDRVPSQPLWIDDPTQYGGKRLNPAAFAIPDSMKGAPQLTAHGNMQRNGIVGPSNSQLDFAIHRDFRFGERFNLNFRAELFNAINHPNFANPFGQYGTVTGDPALGTWKFTNNWPTATSTSSFGQMNAVMTNGFSGNSLSTLYNMGGPRSVQLALKLTF